jgi:hypothetical protein
MITFFRNPSVLKYEYCTFPLVNTANLNKSWFVDNLERDRSMAPALPKSAARVIGRPSYVSRAPKLLRSGGQAPEL